MPSASTSAPAAVIDALSARIAELRSTLTFADSSAAEQEISRLQHRADALEQAAAAAQEQEKAALTALTATRAEIGQLKEQLANAADTDPAALAAQIDEQNALKDAADRQLRAIHTRLSTNESARKGVSKQSAALAALEQRCAWVSALSRTANGGLRDKAKIDLETYVQTTYFDRILCRANLRLQKMSGGQYDLKRRQNAYNKQSKSGLELDIVDHINATERSVNTLSGGEAQRIRLATQIGSGLVGVLYILDEPSIGLHQRDNEKLIATLKHMRDLGNTVIVVEHDEDTMRAADFIVDIGPRAGAGGGEVVAAGTPEEVAANEQSITGDYLSGRKRIAVPTERRPVDKKRMLKVVGARENNLKNLTVSFPLGVLTCVTGVSGSGKSTLVNEILYKSLAQKIYPQYKGVPGKHRAIEGYDQIDKIINIDQSPIGRTPRSNPATYTGAFDQIRTLFAKTKEAQIRGYKAGRFSFNVKGGRCEACKGDGIIKIEMHFLPDVYAPCEVCKGKRYNRETLEVTYHGKNISEVLDMTVDEAVEFFENIPSVYNKIKTIQDVGLGYIKLGQPATTLSGGEAQRVKLATELAKRPTGKTLYILDEPTTGLHTADIDSLLKVLGRLVDNGESMIIIEHNLDVIKCADYIIDLGPEGGAGGGRVVVSGTPEQVAACADSYTGRFLKPLLEQGKNVEK